MTDDLYEVLGVPRDASQAEIKAAYRRRAMTCHPDRHPDDPEAEERFKELARAYNILGDPDRRRRYDRGTLKRGMMQGSVSLKRGLDLFEDVVDVLGAIFTGVSRDRPEPREGRTLRTELTLSYEEALEGGTHTVEYAARGPCPTCHGEGTPADESARTCERCGGRGRLPLEESLWNAFRVCPACDGHGEERDTQCSTCGGTGETRRERAIRLEVPPGVDEGGTIRREGEGEPGDHGGPAGDLLVDVTLEPHPVFERRGNDVYMETSVTFTRAALGGRKTVPTLEGDVIVDVPPGLTAGDRLRLRGRGFPDPEGGPRGDQYIRIAVEAPTPSSSPETGDESSNASGLGDRLRHLWDAV